MCYIYVKLCYMFVIVTVKFMINMQFVDVRDRNASGFLERKNIK